jgi:hypothetical protein
LALWEDSALDRNDQRTDLQVLTWRCRSEWFGILDTDTDITLCSSDEWIRLSLTISDIVLTEVTELNKVYSHLNQYLGY